MNLDEKQEGATSKDDAVETAKRPDPLESGETEIDKRMSFFRHEIRNVLTTITANYKFVKQEMQERGVDLGEDGRDAFEDMGNAIDRLSGVIQMDNSEIDEKISGFKRGASENGVSLKEGAVEVVRQKTVFLIDDETPITKALKRIIQGAFSEGKKPEIIVYSSALEAKQAIESGKRPDYTLCDLMMKGMTGSEYYGWLKEAHADLADKILFISGGTFSSTPNDPNFLEIVKNKILLPKPFDIQEVQDRVKKALGDK